MRLFARALFQERRRTERQRAPQLAAYYWNGSQPAPHSVSDISSSGIYLLTEDRWHYGTLLMLTLQRSLKDTVVQADQSIRLQSKVVRWGTDGVGFAFIFPSAAYSHKASASFQGADRKALIAFSKSLGQG
jgi:hypothetical protein